MEKTLIGKNGVLFLKNDSSRELEVSSQNLCVVSKDFYKRYENIKDKFLLIVFPNKSLIYKDCLPLEYNSDIKYRPSFDIYQKYFGNHCIDSYKELIDIKDTYYKTDTHINNNGAIIVYQKFVSSLNNLFKLDTTQRCCTLTKKIVPSLSELYMGLGDLTWDINLGLQVLETKNDTYYTINESCQIYAKYIFSEDSLIRLYLQENDILVDKTLDNIGAVLGWDIIGKYILYTRNNNLKYTVLIFYDSFLCSTLQLYMELFYEVYCIKSIFRNDIVSLLNPDYIFEFRCERFLF